MLYSNTLVGGSIDEVYPRLVALVTSNGEAAAPRGQPIRELLGFQLRITDPRKCILYNRARKANYQFMVAESLWMMCGFNRVDLIQPFNKNITMAADDGQVAFTGSYGVKIADQLPYVLEILKQDPDSRQAVISIWRERPRATRDVPCTLSMQFFVRKHRVHMHTYMRSNDVFLGVPYDVYNFTMVQQAVACYLGMGLGEYVHTVGSMHAYDRDEEKLKAVIKEGFRNRVVEQQLIKTVPFGQLSAAYAEIASRGPTMDNDQIRRWLLRWMYDVDEPWRSHLVVLARRFITDIDTLGTTAGVWEELLVP